jgi:YVTN family beta-propeller protein
MHSRRALCSALAATGFVTFGGGSALAAQVHCGSTITADTRLAQDLSNCPGDGLVIGADNLTLDLNGHTIDGDATPGANGRDRGIRLAGHHGVTLQGGTVREFDTGALLDAATGNGGALRGGGDLGLLRGWAEPRIPVGDAPQVVALNPETGTLYVSNVEEAFVSVIDAGCAVRGCGAAIAKVPVAQGPVGLTINKRTNTIYVASGGSDGGIVSVIDGAACNARHTAGCDRTPAAVTVGGTPLGIAVNETTNSIYVGTLFEGFLAIIDGRTCNRTNLSGCGRPPATTTAAPNPVVPTVDEATNTIYVTDGGPGADGSGTTVAVIDGRTCNGSTTAGCGRAPATVTVGGGPGPARLGLGTHTL